MKYAALEQLGLDQREITIYRTLISLSQAQSAPSQKNPVSTAVPPTIV